MIFEQMWYYSSTLDDPLFKDCGEMISYCFPSGYCIEKVLLVPACILALILGIVLGTAMKGIKTEFPSKFYYSVSFYTYGVMMTVSMILHSFLHDSSTGPKWVKISRFIFGLVDSGLTSNIAVTFALAGLADLNLWKGMICRYLTYLLWIGVFVAWIYSIFEDPPLFVVLYTDLIGVCGVVWFITQLILFLFSGNPITKKQKVFVVLTMFFASAGLIGFIPRFGNLYCRIVGKKFSSIVHPEIIWFFFSDFAILFLGLFLISTKKTREKASRYFLPLD